MLLSILDVTRPLLFHKTTKWKMHFFSVNKWCNSRQNNQQPSIPSLPSSAIASTPAGKPIARVTPGKILSKRSDLFIFCSKYLFSQATIVLTCLLLNLQWRVWWTPVTVRARPNPPCCHLNPLRLRLWRDSHSSEMAWTVPEWSRAGSRLGKTKPRG